MLNWPNRITIARIVLTPVLVMLAIRADEGPQFRTWTLTLFVVLVLTDAVDGFLARALKQKTELGTFLDPLADKVLLVTATILLVYPLWPDEEAGARMRLLPPSIAVIVISREILLALGTLLIFVLAGNVVIRPSVLGKLTTVAQAAMIAGILMGTREPVRTPLLWGTAFITIASFAGYAYDGCRQLARIGDEKPPST